MKYKEETQIVHLSHGQSLNVSNMYPPVKKILLSSIFLQSKKHVQSL